jgi:hypothetical protein
MVNSLLSEAIGNLQSDRSTTSFNVLDFVRSLLPLKERKDFGSLDYIQRVCGELRKTMPERFNGELELMVSRLLEPDLDQIVRFGAERSINNQLSLEEMQRLLTVVETAGYDSYLRSCLEAGRRATTYQQSSDSPRGRCKRSTPLRREKGVILGPKKRPERHNSAPPTIWSRPLGR